MAEIKDIELKMIISIDITLWQAIKLRIAGEYSEEFKSLVKVKAEKIKK